MVGRERKGAEAVRGAQRGSLDALEELFHLHWPRAYRAAYLVVHDTAAAEDIAQEAFLSALRALDRFDRRRPFGPWLHRIVVNRAIDWARARSARREVRVDLVTEAVVASSGEAGGGPAGAPAPGANASERPYSDELMAALAALPPEQRAVVVLRYLLEHTPGEIARILDLPRGTVNSRLRRGLDRLAFELEEGSP